MINLILVAGTLIIATSCSSNDYEQEEIIKRTNVRTITVQKEHLTIEKSFYSEVRFKQSMMVSAELSGKIEKLTIAPGTRVAKGQVLLSYPPQNHELRVEQVQLAHHELKKNYDRQVILYKKGAVSKISVDQLKTELDIQARQLEQTDEMYIVEAPFSGLITDVMVNIGKEVVPGERLFSIAKTNEMEVDFFVTSEDINVIQSNAEVKIRIKNDTVSGRVTQKALIMDPIKKAYRVKAEFNNSSLMSTIGNTVMIDVEMEKIEDAILIPWEATKQQNGQFYVFMDQNNIAVKRPVEVDRVVGLKLFVKNGLNPGESLIISGTDKLEKHPLITIIK